MFRSMNGFNVRIITKCVVASVTKNTVSATSILDAPSVGKASRAETSESDVTGMWCCEYCCICISLAVIDCMHQEPSDLIFTMPLVYAGTSSAYPVKETSSFLGCLGFGLLEHASQRYSAVFAPKIRPGDSQIV
jgi:hypothetical protein